MIPHRKCAVCGAEIAADVLPGHCANCLVQLTLEVADDRDSPRVPYELRMFGDYELQQEIARGGMGVVYRGRQISLNRPVAIKMILAGEFASTEFVRRFQQEAEAAARLRHPHIVSVFEVGEHDGQHYFSMEYVDGKNLAQLVATHPLSPLEAAGYVKAIAAAIHYAHQNGILHRDLKPSNILIDPFDQPRITDFGLARLLQTDSELTVSGQMLGSPSYMPPEQAEGRMAAVGVHSDIYSLGAVLYHLLTSRPPFQGANISDILRQVQTSEPIPPQRLVPNLPTDLQTICLKCLEKDAVKRYASAQDLADDLGRFLRDVPIRARPTGWLEHAWRWCRRRPALAALAGALSLALAAGTTGVLWQWRRAEEHARAESEQRRLAQQHSQDLAVSLYVADMGAAFQAMQRNDLGLAHRLLEAHMPQIGEPDLRGFEWRYLHDRCRGDQHTVLSGHEWIVMLTRFSPNGKLLASASQDQTVRLWDPALRQHVATLHATTGAVWSIQFTPDGNQLMTAGSDRKVRFWDLDRFEVRKTFEGQFACLSQTGTLMAVADSSLMFWEPAGRVALWDYHSGQKLRELPQAGRGMVFSPDGRTLAIAGPDRDVYLWDVESGHRIHTLPTQRPVWAIEYSRDGDLLATAGWTDRALVWNARSGQLAAELVGHSRNVWRAAFSPDGRTIVTSSSDQTLRLWSVETWRSQTVLRGHESEVWCATFSPDGLSLASGGKDQAVMLWPLEARPESVRLPHSQWQRPLFTPDGKGILAASEHPAGTGRAIWNLAGPKPIAMPIDGDPLGFSPDGKQLVRVSSEQACIEFWTPPIYEAAKTVALGIPSAKLPFAHMGVSAGSERFFGICADGQAVVCDLGPGAGIASFRCIPPPIRSWALGPRGGLLAVSVEREKSIHVYEVPLGRERILEGHKDFVCGLALSADERWLASASVDATIKLWDLKNGGEPKSLIGHMEEATNVAFSPDGRTLASVENMHALKLWHVATGREIVSLAMPKAGLFLRFSPDGERLALVETEDSLQLLAGPFGKEE